MEPVTDGKHLNEHDCALKAILILLSVCCIMLSIFLISDGQTFLGAGQRKKKKF